MYEPLEIAEEKMEKTLINLAEDFTTIRAGRANPGVLSKITVDYYGAATPLQQVANISVPEARILVIQPWDRSLIKAIEKAIQASDVGINPSNDGTVIRLVFPELTEERRKDLSKDVKKKGEAAKVAIRNIRRDCVDSIKKAQKAGEITEDDQKADEAAVIARFEDTQTQAKVAELFHTMDMAANDSERVKAIRETVRKVYEASPISREEGANEMAKAVTRKQKLNQIRTLEVHLS